MLSKAGMLFGVVLLSALLLNVPNSMLLLLMVLAYFLFGSRNDYAPVTSERIMLGLAAWLTIAQFWSDIGSVGWFSTWIWMSIPLSFLAWQHYAKLNSSSWLSTQIMLAAIACMVSIWGVVQFVLFDYGRVLGPLADPNVYACLLNILWFPLFSRFLTAKDSGVVLVMMSITLFLMQLALILASSRAGLLIWLLLCGTLVAWLWRDIDRKKLFIAGLVAIANYAVYSFFSDHLGVSSYGAALGVQQEGQPFERLMMWQSTIHMWLDAPLLGHGLGSWSYLYPLYRLPEEVNLTGYYAHNDYLQLLQEGGLLTWVLCLGVLGGLFVVGIKKTFSLPSGSERNIRVGILLGISAAILHANVNFIFYLIYINILIGIYLARLSQPSCEAEQRETSALNIQQANLTKAALVSLIAVNGFYAMISSAGMGLLRSDTMASRMAYSFSSNFSPYTAASILGAISPSDTLAQKYQNASLENVILYESMPDEQMAGMMNAVLDGYKVLQRENSLDAANYAHEANFLIKFNKRHDNDPLRIERARTLLGISLDKEPSRVDSAILLASTYFDVNDPKAAYDILAKAKSNAWRGRDAMLVDAEVIKHMMPEHVDELNRMQKQLRGMELHCAIEECGKKNLQIHESARKRLTELAGSLPK